MLTGIVDFTGTSHAFPFQSFFAIFGDCRVIDNPQFTEPFIRGNSRRRRKVRHEKFMAFKQHKKDVLAGRAFDVVYDFVVPGDAKYTGVE